MESFLYINKYIASYLYANYKVKYNNLLQANTDETKIVLFEPCFKELYSMLVIMEYNEDVKINKDLMMQVFTHLPENLTFSILVRHLKHVLQQYESHELNILQSVEKLARPFKNRINYLVTGFMDNECVIVSVKFCMIHFDVERVYSHINQKLASKKL